MVTRNTPIGIKDIEPVPSDISHAVISHAVLIITDLTQFHFLNNFDWGNVRRFNNLENSLVNFWVTKIKLKIVTTDEDYREQCLKVKQTLDKEGREQDMSDERWYSKEQNFL